LRSKDETPEVLIDFLRLVQRGLQAQVRIVRTDKGTEFLNQNLHAYFAAEGIHHQMSIARTPEQNGIVKRRNRTFVEVARTMLSAAKVLLYFWAKAIATACFTQNRFLVIPRHEKTSYHIINDRKPSVKFFYIFGSLCYIVRDGENLDKMKKKGDECIFVGYSTQSRAYKVSNKRRRVIMESIHVNFDELPHMASDHISSDPAPECQRMALEHVSLSPAIQRQANVPQADRTVTTSNDLDLLFSLMFDELLNGSSKVVSKSSAVCSADAPNQYSDHAGCLDSRKSTSSGIHFLGGDKLVSWSSKRQDYYGFYFDKIPMYCDSKEAIAISYNPVQHSRTKHINVRYHFIKEKVEKGIVELFFVGTEYQLADLFTKALPEERFKYLVRRLGVNPLIDHHCCYKCRNSLNYFFCYQCTCEFCGNGAHVGYNFPAQVPSFQTLPSFPQQYPCCEDCRKQEEKQIEEEQTAKAQNLKIPVCYDDDDDYNSAITPNEPVDSLSMGDEHLDTVLATKPDEFIKSSVENLVPNPKSLLNHDSSIIPSSLKIDSLLDEFVGELTLLKSILPGIDKTDCYPEDEIRFTRRLLYDNSSPRPPEEFVSKNSNADIKSFSPSPIPIKDSDSFMEEIDLTFTPDDQMLPSIEEDDYDSERDILILEELLDNYSLSLPENESFHFNIPSFCHPPAKPPDGNT
nr:hypothetical protein [Tanacetum cinerariifolium]